MGQINYTGLMVDAMRGLIASVLRDVASNGLAGKHHFYVQFDTRADGVEMAAHLRASYPKNMTIIIQDWYENLRVFDTHFEVSLNFDNQVEPLVIPFAAIESFADPSVEFVLQFQKVEVAGDVVAESNNDNVENIVSFKDFKKR